MDTYVLRTIPSNGTISEIALRTRCYHLVGFKLLLLPHKVHNLQTLVPLRYALYPSIE